MHGLPNTPFESELCVALPRELCSTAQLCFQMAWLCVGTMLCMGDDGSNQLVAQQDAKRTDAISIALRSTVNLDCTKLLSTKLLYTNLQSTNLQSTNLQSTNLLSANLQSTNLQSTNFQSTYLLPTNLLSSCPVSYREAQCISDLGLSVINTKQHRLLFAFLFSLFLSCPATTSGMTSQCADGNMGKCRTPTFPVDTHIHRLAQRWGLTKGKTVEQTEADLKVVFQPCTDSSFVVNLDWDSKSLVCSSHA